MRKLPLIFLLLFLAGTVILSPGCRKDVLTNDPSASLEFSTDTLTFDTVFTTLGSTTLFFKVYNPNGNGVLTDVILAGGDASNFRINVDGAPGNKHKDVEIYGEDSTYVFVEVTVDPNNQNTPLVIIDSVIFETNGNRQRVILEAWGQDAHFYKDSVIPGGNWSNDKPYVILKYAVVDSGAALNIDAGTQIYMGGNAQFIVYGTGKINVRGTKDNPVIFQGIRLEDFYDDLPGQWAGIFILRGSRNNSFEYTIIKNSDYGLNIGSVPNRIDTCADISTLITNTNIPQVTIKNSIIQNSFHNGLSALFSEINAENCLLFNSGDNLVSLAYGGNYMINHCTFANYGSSTINHQTPTFFTSNVLYCDFVPFIAELILKVDNIIVYGSLDEEIEFEVNDTNFSEIIFDHCLVKTELQSDTIQFYSTITNQDPQFTDRTEDDYTIKDNSPCINAGKMTSIMFDLNGNMRVDTPDIGAYEYAP